MSDPAREKLIREVNQNKALIVQVAYYGYQWPCRNCGHMMGYENDGGWLRATEIGNAVESITCKRRGPSYGIAINSLISEGVLEINNSLKLRLAESSGRS